MHPVRKREMGDTTLSYAVGNKGAEFSLAGLPSPHREHLLNKGPATLSAALPSPSSLRDATSPKVRGLGSPPSLQFGTLRPAAARGAVRRCAQTFRLCQGLPLWGSWREAPERARTLTRSCALGLALPCGSVALSEARSKPRPCYASAILALSVIASRCHLSQSERPWQSAKFAVWNLYALLPQGEPSGAALRLHAFAKGSHFGGAGAKRLRGRARQRRRRA